MKKATKMTKTVKSYFLTSNEGVERLGPDRDDVASLRQDGQTLYGCRCTFDVLLDVQREIAGLYGPSPKRKVALSRLRLACQEIWLED